ncbi:DNA polymerase delta, subunit 4-domain-containing protein [Mariannaea sp. PMI_226]|nr:DNA polymerase delta, subunit 4-domain-containing protein [Mariannaea sp. PMI_226]
MPTTRKSTGSTRGVPDKGQSTLLSFSNKVTKSVPKDTKALIAPSVAKVEAPKQTKEEEDDVVPEEEQVEEEEEEEEEEPVPEIAAVPEKSDNELRAEKITGAQIKSYYKGIENQWKSPRVHQEGLSLEEKVLRYFDVSSQYGPCIGISRKKRWLRADRLGLSPPVEVLAVLIQEEAKDNKKAGAAHMDDILNSTAIGQ